MTSGEFRRAKHADLSGQQVADRLAIRELVDTPTPFGGCSFIVAPPQKGSGRE
jgi:hypothetical protein